LLEDVLERRSYELKLEGDGLTTREIAAETAAKFDVDKSVVYREWAHREKWQRQVQEFNVAMLKAHNKLEQLYRKTSFMYSQRARSTNTLEIKC